MTATTFSPSLSRPGWVAELRALGAVIKRSWFIFRRYPSMLASMFIWPIIFPAIYIFSARALAGPNGAGLDTFMQATGSSNYIGYIAVGTTIWMWQNVALWTVGFALREEQMRGTLESNWLSPTWRFSFLLGSGLLQVINLGLFVMISGLEFWLVVRVQDIVNCFKHTVYLGEGPRHRALGQGVFGRANSGLSRATVSGRS